MGPANCPVRVVRFSPDGGLVVTGHDTGAVQVDGKMGYRSSVDRSYQ